MGIQGYFSYVMRTYRDCVTDTDLRSLPWKDGWRPDDLFFDVNNLMYNIARRAKNQDHYFVLLFMEIDQILNLCPPMEHVFLAMDGPGPRAKILTQRARRMALAHEQVLGGSPASAEEDGINTLNFTPGSIFMDELKGALCYFAAQRVGSASSGAKFVVSGADRIGEGEMKIFQFMQEQPAGAKSLVIGNDADLILYSLLSRRDIRILRLDSQRSHVIDTQRLRRRLTAQIPNADPDKVVEDFVVLSLLNGNDYFPKLQGFNLDRAWSLYVRQKRTGPFSGRWLYQPENGILDLDFAEAVLPGHSDSEFSAFNSRNKGMPPKGVLARVIQQYCSSPGTLTPSYYVKQLPSGDFHAQVWLGRLTTKQEPESPDDESRFGRVLGGTGQGRSERAAEHDASRRALLSDSVVAMLLEEARRLPAEEESVRARNLIQGVVDAFRSNAELQFDPLVEAMSLGDVPDERRREQLEAYVGAMGWVMEYLKGNCPDYNFMYPWGRSPPSLSPNKALSMLPKAERAIRAEVPRDVYSRPQAPAEFGLSLTPASARHMLPKELSKLMEPGSPISDLWHTEDKLWQADRLPQTLKRIARAVRQLRQRTKDGGTGGGESDSFVEEQVAGAQRNQPSLRFRRKQPADTQPQHLNTVLPKPPGPRFRPVRSQQHSPIVVEVERLERSQDKPWMRGHAANTGLLNLRSDFTLGHPGRNPFVEHVGKNRRDNVKANEPKKRAYSISVAHSGAALNRIFTGAQPPALLRPCLVRGLRTGLRR